MVSNHKVYLSGFFSGDRDYVVRSLLGKAGRGGSEPGEVLATIAGLGEHDDGAWFEAWSALGARVAGIAAGCAQAGHRVSAARAYLRAANYLAVAVDVASALDDDAKVRAAFDAHRAAWEGFVASTRWPVERVAIPYEGSTLPGWFFHPDDAGDPRPTLIVNNGSDGALSGLWSEAAEGALERGYGVLLFDGPGQQSVFFERGVPFRYDWEAVLTPVVDTVLARPDVDPGRLAVYGISQAGYWVSRALAFEHRVAAAVLDGGVVDVARSWTSQIPHSLMELYRKGEVAKFERDMSIGMKLPGGRATLANWNFRARPYGTTGFAATLDEVSRYTVEQVAAQVDTPVLITSPEREQFFPGQSKELAALIPGAQLLELTEAEGASFHCQPLARELTEQRVFDWLDERLATGVHAR